MAPQTKEEGSHTGASGTLDSEDEERVTLGLGGTQDTSTEGKSARDRIKALQYYMGVLIYYGAPAHRPCSAMTCYGAIGGNAGVRMSQTMSKRIPCSRSFHGARC